MSNDTDRLLRKIYGEIVAGYSFADFFGETIYIKHFGLRDNLEYDYKYHNLYESYLKKGVLSESEKLSTLIKEGIWPQSKESRLKDIRETINLLQTTKRSHYSLREIDHCNEQIKQNHQWYVEIASEKAVLIGESAESIARRNIDAQQIVGSFYADESLKKRKFPDIDSMSEDELSASYAIYDVFMQSTNDYRIRQVSLTPDFLTSFALSDNLFYFYGCPISKLTTLQTKLAECGQYYKHILNSDRNPPEDVKRDPDKLEDWFFARNNIEKILAKNEESGRATSLADINAKELKYLGLEVDNSEVDRMRKILEENGGQLSGQDFKKMRM